MEHAYRNRKFSALRTDFGDGVFLFYDTFPCSNTLNSNIKGKKENSTPKKIKYEYYYKNYMKNFFAKSFPFFLYLIIVTRFKSKHPFSREGNGLTKEKNISFFVSHLITL